MSLCLAPLLHAAAPTLSGENSHEKDVRLFGRACVVLPGGREGGWAGVGWGGGWGESGREGGIGERVQVDLPRKIVASRTAKRVLVAPPAD